MGHSRAWTSVSFSAEADNSGATDADSSGDKTKLGLNQLNAVQDMAEQQVKDMLRLHKTMTMLVDSCRRISTFAGNLIDVEKNMAEAHRIADSTVGQKTGIGQISEQFDTIKAMACDSTHKIKDAKASIDNVIPRMQQLGSGVVAVAFTEQSAALWRQLSTLAALHRPYRKLHHGDSFL
mmetsp:Transcript_56001/g.103600  ORF Transcript_56001/g.103600 Transcript_56001/m.103600 type:complete len:179 (+) Transcript_56001:115-651(+)